MKAGLLLLTGGSGRRMGSPKHALAHPAGGTWGAYLVHVFQAVFASGPVMVLGDSLPDQPGWPCVEDPRLGPAVALRTWAAVAAPAVDRWWVTACDQVRWTPERLEAWAVACESADPLALHWILALHEGHSQPLGSWLPTGLRPALATAVATSLQGLVEELPHLLLPQAGPEWKDVDTPSERAGWEEETP